MTEESTQVSVSEDPKKSEDKPVPNIALGVVFIVLSLISLFYFFVGGGMPIMGGASIGFFIAAIASFMGKFRLK